MEMIKLLNEAKANGLSKEEFFQLIDLELKMNENKKQVSGTHFSSSDASASAAVGFEKLLWQTCEKLENQQKWQHQNLQQTIRELFEQQKQQQQNQFQHLQQHLQQQQESQFKILQQQQESKQQNVQGQRDLTKASEGNLDQAVKDMKDKFLEMRSTVLNRLQEEKVFMRDALSKAQKDILDRLSKTEEDVSHVKEAVGTDAFARIEKKIGQVQWLCEEQLQTQQKKLQEDQRDTTGVGSQEIIQDSLKTLVEDLETSIEEKLENAVGSLKKELQEIKESNVPAKVQDKKAEGECAQQTDNGLSHYFYINAFESCVRGEQFIESTPMYVDKLRTTVRGYVQFVDGEMEVWLNGFDLNDCTLPHPCEVSIKASITGLTENLPAKEIGEKSFCFDDLFLNSARPLLIGSISCNEVIRDGYIMYKSGAVLLRYEISVQGLR